MSIGKIESAQITGGSKLAITFDDGVQAAVDLGPIIKRHAAIAPLADPAEFDRVRVSEDGWSVEWPEIGIDFGAQQLRRWADEQSGRTMSMESFRQWMQRNTLTLDAAADALGLSRRTIAYYLSGEQPIPRTVMLATEGLEARQFA
ncbi:MAG: hypothetical protein QOF34_388 [Sphingomonadales bacterium]|jgi:hypothetical protein|nr:hypothetical protein [Sphingomonadales bacterium]